MTVPGIGGRPFAFNSPEEMVERVEAYFQKCDDDKEVLTNDKGQTKVVQRPYTITGLCLYLGITKETWSQYSKKPDYDEVVKMAKQRVENYVEENSLMGKLNPIVSIFNLKNNFGWTDKIDISTNMQQYQLSPEEVRQRLKDRGKMFLIEGDRETEVE